MCELQCIVKELERRELARLAGELESINARLERLGYVRSNTANMTEIEDKYITKLAELMYRKDKI